MVHKNVKARMALIIGSPSSRLSHYSHLITNNIRTFIYFITTDHFLDKKRYSGEKTDRPIRMTYELNSTIFF